VDETAWHVACKGEKGYAGKVSVGNLKERDHLEDVDTVGRMLIKLISKKWNGYELN
jgi:hypothetical protein